MVGEPVQQGSDEAFRAEDLGPLIEWEVGGHQDRASLVALAEDLEEQFRAGAGERREAQLVDDLRKPVSFAEDTEPSKFINALREAASE